MQPPSPQQARLIWLALSGLALAVLVALGVALVWGLGRVVSMLSPVLWPIAVAGVLAYLLDPLVDFFERKARLARPKAIIAVFTLALLVIAGLFGSVVPQLVAETRQLAVQVPAYAQRLQRQVDDWVAHPPEVLKRLLEKQLPPPPAHPSPALTNSQAAPELTTLNALPAGAAKTNAPSLLESSLENQHIQSAASWLASALREAGLWLFSQVGTWMGILAGLALIPVYTFYFLLEKRGISSHWTNYLPVSDSTFKKELVFVLSAINNYLIAFFRGQVLVAICDAVLYTIGFLIIGLPYALLIGAVAVFLTMIPFLGAFLICTTALIISLVQFGDWQHPLLVLLVFSTVQMLESLVISPKIMGNRVGLHPVTIIIAVMTGTTLLGGLLGGILAIPLTAALRVILFRYIWKRPAPQD